MLVQMVPYPDPLPQGAVEGEVKRGRQAARRGRHLVLRYLPSHPAAHLASRLQTCMYPYLGPISALNVPIPTTFISTVCTHT